MTSQPRAYVSKDIDEDMATISNAEASGSSTSTEVPLIPGQEPATSEISQIRAFLQPPSIPGVEDWGIPPETTEPCDPEIEVKLILPRGISPSHPIHRRNLRNLQPSNEIRNIQNISMIPSCQIVPLGTHICTPNLSNS